MEDFSNIPVSSRLLKAVEKLEQEGIVPQASAPHSSDQLSKLQAENTQLKQKHSEAKQRIDAMLFSLKEEN